MSREIKMRKLFEDWTDAKAALENEYTEKRNEMWNRDGDLYVDEIVGLNQWYIQKENELLNLFTGLALKLTEE